MVHIEDYLPLRIKKIDHIRDFCISEDPLFEVIENLNLEWVKNTSPLEADINGVVKWEEMLDLTPDADADLDERRFAIQAALGKRLPYTWATVYRIVEALCGKGNFEFTRDEPFTLTVKLRMDSLSNMRAVLEMLEEIIPMHILLIGEQTLTFGDVEISIGSAEYIKEIFETPFNFEEYKKWLTAKAYIALPLVSVHIYETPIYEDTNKSQEG